MRTLNLIIFVALLSIINFPVNGMSSSDNVIIPSTQEIGTQPNNRPKLPSRKGIRCSYSNTHIEMQFPEDVSMMTVSIYNDNETIWYGILTKEEPYADLPDIVGEYSIECVADNGKTYSCILYF